MSPTKTPRSLFARTDRKKKNAPRAPSPEPRKGAAAKTTVPDKDQTVVVRAVSEEKEEKALSVKPIRDEVSPEKPQQNLGSSQSSLNISQLRKTFDSQSPNRTSWTEGDYSQLIHKLDRLQTEAFILKGKLLDEAKKKFFESSRQGWAEFCDQKLGMNYTTANQYIRVALEFDVTSHQFPQLGFEHFKALLPVPSNDRKAVLESFDGGSVQSLRRLVQEQSKHSPSRGASQNNDRSLQSARQMLKALQNIHSLMATLNTDALSQQLRWQLSAACSQIASQLLQFSNKANDSFINDKPIEQQGETQPLRNIGETSPSI